MSEDDVRAVEAAYDDAWTRGDLEAVLRCLTADIIIETPTGATAVGIEQARALLGSVLRGPAAGTRHIATIRRVAFVTPDVAVVDGQAHIEGAEAALPTHRFTDIVTRQDGTWRIAHVRAYR